VTSHTFPDEVVRAISHHMNDDHGADSLLIVKALGGLRGAESARMTGMDGDGADFEAQVDGANQTVRVPWRTPLTERAQVRPEIVWMYQESCRILGIEPRQPGEH
jgi:putative heme iron utilization protein